MSAAAEQMWNHTGEFPEGNDVGTTITKENITDVSPDGTKSVGFDDDAAARIVRGDYERSKAYLERNSWLMEWQATDVLYQSPNYDNWVGVRDGRPVRISRFLIAKNSNTMSNQIHRSIWTDQVPFALLGEQDTNELELEAWTHLIGVLLKRADAEYQLALGEESQTVQGTGIWKPGWEVRERVIKGRRRKKPAETIDLPVGGQQQVDTQESDDFEDTVETVQESYPVIEYRRLGWTMYDPKWKTPNRPDLSAGYVVHVDMVDFQDLQLLRDVPCYKNIPTDEKLIEFFINNPLGDAAPASQTSDQMSSQNSIVMHAEGEERQTSLDPFERPLKILERWTDDRVTTVLVYNDKYITIRNDEHDLGCHALGYTANWWNIENCGYGFGVGRLNSGDQRMQAGVLNEVLKMIGMWFNTPLLIARGHNAPSQNVVAGLATFLQVDTPPDGDVRKAMAYIERPQIPGEAWRIYELAQQGGEQLVGADEAFMQGHLGGPGSSAARTATGASRISSKADEGVAKQVGNTGNVLARFIEFIVERVKTKMPIAEIRQILKKKYSDEILKAIDLERFLNVKFEINVLAGQKLMAKQAIMQLIPFLLQILQQPQLLDALHQTGRTIDFQAIEGLFLRMSELQTDDNIFRPMRPRERVQFRSQQPGGPLGARVALERVKTQGKLQQIAAQGQTDLTTRLAEAAVDRGAGAVPLERAEALNERAADQAALRGGLESE
jgi:hypothetical protein